MMPSGFFNLYIHAAHPSPVPPLPLITPLSIAKVRFPPLENVFSCSCSLLYEGGSPARKLHRSTLEAKTLSNTPDALRHRHRNIYYKTGIFDNTRKSHHVCIFHIYRYLFITTFCCVRREPARMKNRSSRRIIRSTSTQYRASHAQCAMIDCIQLNAEETGWRTTELAFFGGRNSTNETLPRRTASQLSGAVV